MAKKKGPSPDEPEQQHLPTMEQEKNPVVHPKATLYVRLRDKRIAANKAEKDAKVELINVMLEEGLSVYEYKGLRVDITNEKGVVVQENGDGDGKKKGGEEE